VDAVNVHPFEFLSGEFLHLLCIMIIPCHVVTVLVFIIIGGIAASLNHTRFDVRIPYLYEVRSHDIHHRLPQTNYGQYTMFWDQIMGSFRPYEAKAGHSNEHEE
jgi:sterol desaturase/sphingolipid hydroxylase (fatty acid hydroxylase superfamily)